MPIVDGTSDIQPANNDPKAPENAELTFGQKAVGITFNPSSNYKVEVIKAKFASIIDDLESFRNPENEEKHPEVARMLSIAITEAQTAQMWAVKAVTWQY